MTSLLISGEAIHCLLEDGFSSDEAREQGMAGSGLGLGIVKRALDVNSGNLEIVGNIPHRTNIPDGFARNIFRIRLPKRE